jgi:dihydropteroate synthase
VTAFFQCLARTAACPAASTAFVSAGVDILDIGGESTRPGSQPVSAEQEIERVVPVIEAIVAAGLDAVISVDTYKAEVAEAALQAGAHWVNDVWGLRADPEMVNVVARHSCPVILMHNRIKPGSAQLQERLGGRYIGIDYQDLIEDIKAELLASVNIALSAGVQQEKIILDPGIGFGKTVEQNLELLNRLGEIRSLGYPSTAWTFAQVLYRLHTRSSTRSARGRHCCRSGRGYRAGSRHYTSTRCPSIGAGCAHDRCDRAPVSFTRSYFACCILIGIAGQYICIDLMASPPHKIRIICQLLHSQEND